MFWPFKKKEPMRFHFSMADWPEINLSEPEPPKPEPKLTPYQKDLIWLFQKTAETLDENASEVRVTNSEWTDSTHTANEFMLEKNNTTIIFYVCLVSRWGRMMVDINGVQYGTLFLSDFEHGEPKAMWNKVIDTLINVANKKRGDDIQEAIDALNKIRNEKE